jgi:PAS domain S-box-containing protein
LTAILFLISGCALVLLAIGSRGTAHIAHALMLPGAMLSYMVPVSYLLGVQAIHAWLNVPVALNTGLAFCALSVAIFCARPDTWLMSGFTSDRSGSVMARQLLPALLMLPLLIGWLRLHGERAGYFESAVGVVLVAITYAVCFLCLLWLSARSVNQTDDERQTAEQALKESEQKLRLFIEHAPAAIAMFDLDMRYMSVSQRWLTDYELGDQDIIGRSHYEIFPEIPERWRKVHQRGLAGAIEKCEEDPFPRMDGSIDWVRWEVHPWYDHKGNIGGIIIFSEDITERKQAEIALQTTMQRFFIVLSSMYSAVLLMTDEGRAEFANQAFYDRFGLEDALTDLVGLNARDIIEKIKNAYLHPDEAVARIREIIDRGQPVKGEELAMQDGGTCLRDFVPLNIQGKSYGRLWLHHDITERKQAEEELNEHRMHLEELVMQRTQELEDKNLQLHEEMIERVHAEEEKIKLEVQLLQAQRMEALGKLAGGIAHDLNNILQPILINSEMISDKLPQGTQEREYLDQIIDVAQLGKNLIKQIKSFGSSQKPIRKPIPIGPVIHKTLAIVKRTLSSDIKLNQRITMNEHLVNADPIQINQLVLNLCSNAVQSMTPQGGTLDVSLNETVVTQSTPAICNDLKPGKYMILTVRDTGSGINPEIMKSIFDPFFTTRKSDKGTGLGLAVVYEVVKNSQGSILLYSEVGKGTRFEIFFPLHLDSLN